MERTRLQDDLLSEFKEEKDLITEQIELFDPLATSLRKRVASRVLNKGVIITFEVLCWLSIAGISVFCVFRDRLRPFHILARLRENGEGDSFHKLDIDILYWSITGFAALLAIFLFVIARNLAVIRKKNDILQLAAANIKIVVGQHLKRKASIDAIEQRHFGMVADPALNG